jgi:hypothetical protein
VSKVASATAPTPKKAAASTSCGACEKPPRKGTKRRRCGACNKLVCPSCWYQRTRVCLGCYGEPQSPEEHLARIEEKRQAVEEALRRYENDCMVLWDGDTKPLPQSPDKAPLRAWQDWVTSIEEAADALGLSLQAPSAEPWQEFPYVPKEGDDPDPICGQYDISNLRALVGTSLKIVKGGKNR